MRATDLARLQLYSRALRPLAPIALAWCGLQAVFGTFIGLSMLWPGWQFFGVAPIVVRAGITANGHGFRLLVAIGLNAAGAYFFAKAATKASESVLESPSAEFQACLEKVLVDTASELSSFFILCMLANLFDRQFSGYGWILFTVFWGHELLRRKLVKQKQDRPADRSSRGPTTGVA